MDRFIDGIKNINEDVIYYLKSNMDRFIVFDKSVNAVQ